MRPSEKNGRAQRNCKQYSDGLAFTSAVISANDYGYPYSSCFSTFAKKSFVLKPIMHKIIPVGIKIT